jgi:hypothetical protein
MAHRLRTFASYPLNGRQIKNSMRIACALASSSGKALSFDDLDTTAQATVKFAEALQSRLGEQVLNSDDDAEDTLPPSRKRKRI